MAQELYQLQPKVSLGSVLARSSLFRQISENERSSHRVAKHSSLKHMRHKQNVDLLFSASSRIQTPKQNPIAVFAKTPVKEEFNRDFAWSLRIVEKSLNLEMEKTFKKSSRDASSLIERQIENKAIRNLTSFQSAYEEAEDELQRKSLKETTVRSSMRLPPIEPKTMSTCKSDPIDPPPNALKNQFISKYSKLKTKCQLETSQIDTTQDSVRNNEVRMKQRKKKKQDDIPDAVESPRKLNKSLFQRNQKLLMPYRELIRKEMSGHFTLDEKQKYHLENSIAMLTLLQEIKCPAPDLKKYEFQKDKHYFALPIRQITKNVQEKILGNMLKDEDHVQGFVKEVWYEFANEEEAQNYLLETTY